jgi:protoheme IX farnesyltransferase
MAVRDLGGPAGLPILGGALVAPSSAATGHRSFLHAVAVFVKPHIVVTFVLVGVAGSFLAGAGHRGGAPVLTVLAVAAAVTLLSAGAECWTNILDRRIDALMPRTAKRPLVTGEISAREAAALASALCLAGLVLAATLGPVPMVFLGLGLVNNVVVYSLLTKRASPWSVVLGSLVAPLTLWAGYSAVAVPLSAAAWLLGGMVGVWIFVHIWVIALRYRADYAQAQVPMAPLVWSRAKLAFALGSSGLLMSVLGAGALLEIGGAAGRWASLAVAVGSVLVTVQAVLSAREGHPSSSLVHAITAYLIIVLGLAIGCVL